MSTIEERIAETVGLYEWAVQDQRAKALEAIEAGNYSTAATACHRAHQSFLMATAVREVGEDD